ncbi:MAG: hypothetical protein ON057_000337 [Glomeribacter sp. 1016415]|nr:hypothetical protein [Glomeribacter sp. 1016415]
MKELEQFKEMVGDLKRRQAIFKKQAQEFQVLQHEIAALKARAHIDPNASKKLRRLDDVMHPGGQPLDTRILGHIAKTEQCFKQLSNQLKLITLDDGERRENGVLASKPATVRQFSRAFV